MAVSKNERLASVLPKDLLALSTMFSSHRIRIHRDLPMLLGQQQKGGNEPWDYIPEGRGRGEDSAPKAPQSRPVKVTDRGRSVGSRGSVKGGKQARAHTHTHTEN